jgi:hypothetical protein
MPYAKMMVCLANSRKMSGRCLAGKEIGPKGRLGDWIRPISDRPTQEISEEERRFENGDYPQLLDIIEITMREARPHAHQSENHLIDPQRYWIKRGGMSWDELQSAIDEFKGPLWVDGYHSYSGLNDRIPENQTATLGSSLLLIEPKNLVIKVAVEGAGFGNPKRKVRAQFSFNKNSYTIAITDPVIEREYLARENGEYPIETALLCVSIGEPYLGYCYKLVAAVITPGRSQKR